MVRKGKTALHTFDGSHYGPNSTEQAALAVTGFWQMGISLPSNCLHHNSGIHHEEREAQVWHWVCFWTSKIPEEQNANKLILHIKQIMANIKQPFICVQKELFV